jgi:hypothetical protein
MWKIIAASIAVLALNTVLLAPPRIIYVYVYTAGSQGSVNSGAADSAKDLKQALARTYSGDFQFWFWICEDPENADIKVLVKSRDVKTATSATTGRPDVYNVIYAQVEFETDKTDMEGECAIGGWPCATMNLAVNIRKWAEGKYQRIMDLRDKK